MPETEFVAPGLEEKQQQKREMQKKKKEKQTLRLSRLSSAMNFWDTSFAPLSGAVIYNPIW